MNVFWTDAALAQLDAIHDYFAQTSPDYAKRIVDRLTHRSQLIGEFPLSGRRVPEYDLPEVREMIESPYRIIYLIMEESHIEVLSVIHTSRDRLKPLG